jgi:alkane 1-monooxygenase
VWHPSNEVLQSYALTLVIQGALIVVFGWIMLPFLLVQNFFGWWQLTSANYIEHYGLLRQRKPNGGYEHCQPWHSWNADYIASNLLLFQLERHSDHHANPTRRYQSLRSFANLPTLPTGYSGMYAIAMLPALWYRVMDKRVLALPHIAGDFDKVNIAPGRRAELEARYARVSCQPHAAQEA